MTIFVLKIPEFGVQIPEWQAVVVVVVVAFSSLVEMLGEVRPFILRLRFILFHFF